MLFVHLSLGLYSTQSTTLQPAYSLSATASGGALLLRRSPDLEADAGTANLSMPFLGAVLGTNCTNDTKATGSQSWVVDGLPGGGYPRCYTAVTPATITSSTKLPVLIYLTGVGLNIKSICGPCCDDEDDVVVFADLMNDGNKSRGFAMICPEPLLFGGLDDDGSHADGQGMWDIPSPQTDALGQRCSVSRDYDLMLALVNDLSARPEMDIDNLYVFGNSLGAEAAAVWSVCLREALDKVGKGDTLRACAPKIIEPPAVCPASPSRPALRPFLRRPATTHACAECPCSSQCPCSYCCHATRAAPPPGRAPLWSRRPRDCASRVMPPACSRCDLNAHPPSPPTSGTGCTRVA
jgi:hypothetical protein